MELTGKCKTNFDNWYNQNGEYLQNLPLTLQGFKRLHSSMQYGVLVDFFYSVGILVEFSLYETSVTIIDYDHHVEEQVYKFDVTHEFESSKNYRLDYMDFAIKKANEIFNNR